MTYNMSLPFQFQSFVYFIMWGDSVTPKEAHVIARLKIDKNNAQKYEVKRCKNRNILSSMCINTQ